MIKIMGNFTIIEVLAINSDYPEDGLQDGLFIHYSGDKFGDGDGVFFGFDMPEDMGDLKNILDPYNYMDTDSSCLDSMIIK